MDTDSLMSELYRKHQEAFNSVLEGEFVRVIGQAIKCGDIQSVCRQDCSAVGIVYIPYRDKMDLETKIQSLKAENANLKAAFKQPYCGICGKDIDELNPPYLDRDELLVEIAKLREAGEKKWRYPTYESWIDAVQKQNMGSCEMLKAAREVE